MAGYELPAEYIALRDYLKVSHGAKPASGGKECIIRCPFCGDSKDLRDAHLYVGIKKTTGVISYNCFKCNKKGSVDTGFFRILGIYDSNIITAVLRYNQSLGTNIWSDSSSVATPRTFYATTQNSVIPIKDTEEYRRKLLYINNRIGGMLTLRDLQDYKIILNLKDYLDANGIHQYTRDVRILAELSFGFIGFLSADSTHVTMRRLVPEEKVNPSLRSRYVGYTIDDSGSKIYCIREGFNQDLPNIIGIAEGPFDILSVHYNMMCLMMNKILFATNGKGVDAVIRYLLFKKKVSLMNSTIHVFIDSDISPKDLMNYRMFLQSLGLPYVIHRNGFEGEKDYGVPGEKMIDTIFERRV